MANAVEIGSGLATRIFDRSVLGASANLGRAFLKSETRSPPRYFRVSAELEAAKDTGGYLAKPVLLKEGQMFNFTIKRGVSLEGTVGVNYDGFIHDVEVGDVLLVDGGILSHVVRSKAVDTLKCEVVDGGELKSRRHLNVRGKSATLPSITEKDWGSGQ